MAVCFISYARDDQAWAEWIGWQLQDAGHETWLDVLELRPGDDWRAEAAGALRRAELVLALASPSYGHSRHAKEELAAALASGVRVIPLLLGDGPVPEGLDDLRDRQFVRLADLDESRARQTLLDAVAPDRPSVGGRLRRYGATSPRLPGTRPRVWRVPRRADRFVGRVELLKDVRAALTETSRAVLVGEPGAGKTQLAIEYAQRFAGEYELVWWIAPGSGHAAMTQVADLATRLGAPETDLSPSRWITALTAELRVRNRWLLVFDDVLETADAELPDRLLRDTGTGQILLISRTPQWTGFGNPIEVGPLSSEESMALLRDLAPTVTAGGARAVAAGGDILPLAVEMTAGAINSGVSVGAYSRALPTDGPDTSPPYNLANTVRIGLAELSERNPRAVALLSACALLAPEPFRLRDCTHVPDWTPEPLAALLQDGRLQAAALEAVNRFDLARRSDDTVRVHAAVQSLLRDQMSPAEREEAALGAQALLVSALPSLRASRSGSRSPALLLPHLLTIAPRDLTREEGLKAACSGCVRLLEDGDATAAVPRLTALREASTALLGEADPTTMEITSFLIDGLQKAGKPETARQLADTRLQWLRSRFGEGKPVTLHAAAQLTTLLVELEDWEEALDLGRQTQELMRATLGPDHPGLLDLSSTLLTPFRALHREEEGLRLGNDTLARQRRTLGPDHPDTLRTAARLTALLVDADNLERACDLGEEVFRLLGTTQGPDTPARYRAAVLWAVPLIGVGRESYALDLLEPTLERQEQTLGPDHIEVLRTAALLAVRRLSLGMNGPQDATALASYAQKADVTPETRQRLLDDSPPLKFTINHLTDGILRTAVDILKPDPAAPSPRPASPTDRNNVLISHVEADRVWADWVGSELEHMGYGVRTVAEDSRLGRPLFRESDSVLVLLSPEYLASVGPTLGDTADWAGLVNDPHRFIPLFVKRVDPLQLPRALRDPATPALYDLDLDAARDVLQITVEEPARPGSAPAFPGAPTPSESDDALLTHRLVNALDRSASLQRRDSRSELWDRLGVANRESVSPRTALFELVRILRAEPDGLTALVRELERWEPDSLATAEVRNVVAEIQRTQEAR